jgi:hypothetical protein
VADQPDYLLRTPFKRSMQAYIRKRAKALDEIGLVYTTEESIKELCRLTSKLNQFNIK